MPNDKTPDPRFAMLALEVFGGELPPPTPPPVVEIVSQEMPRTDGLVLRSRVFVDEVNDLMIPDDHPALVRLTQTMMSILGLEDFDTYAGRRRNENSNTCITCGASWNKHTIDCGRFIAIRTNRRTGRTTRGLLDLMVRHYLATTNPTMWVLGSSERVDAWLRNEVFNLHNRLSRGHPIRVGIVTNVGMLEERGLRPPAGVMLYVDHTYYERGRGRAGRGVELTYKPD